MQKSKLCLASLLVLLAQGDVGLGKPGSPVEKLMRQKVSAFSFGMFRLEKDVQSLLPNLKEVDKDIMGARVGYDRKQNLIIIDLIGAGSEGLSDTELEKRCREAFHILRTYALLDDVKGQGLASTFADDFFPAGYVPKNGNQIGRRLDSMIVLAYESKNSRCTSELLGGAIIIEKK